MDTLLQNLRYALRMLRKSPGFSMIAVLTLSLGMGANTAVFSALNAVLLRSMPVRNPQELRLINWEGRNPQLNGYTGMGIGVSDAPSGSLQMGTSFPYPAYRDFRDHGQGFTDVFAFFSLKSVTAVARGKASLTSAMLVSGNYFSGYGAGTLIGRPIQPEDNKSGAALVAVITYRWWERYCGLDPHMIGKAINLNRVSYTVIGVLPVPVAGSTVMVPQVRWSEV